MIFHLQSLRALGFIDWMFRMKKAASSFGRERLHLSCSFWDLVCIVGLVVMPVWRVIATFGRSGAAEEKEEEVAYLLLTTKVGVQHAHLRGLGRYCERALEVLQIFFDVLDHFY